MQIHTFQYSAWTRPMLQLIVIEFFEFLSFFIIYFVFNKNVLAPTGLYLRQVHSFYDYFAPYTYQYQYFITNIILINPFYLKGLHTK